MSTSLNFTADWGVLTGDGVCAVRQFLSTGLGLRLGRFRQLRRHYPGGSRLRHPHPQPFSGRHEIVYDGAPTDDSFSRAHDV